MLGDRSRLSGRLRDKVAGAEARTAHNTDAILNVAINYNPVLDPHKQSSVQLQGSSGVMQRLFRFKTDTNPEIGLNWDTEPSLALDLRSSSTGNGVM